MEGMVMNHMPGAHGGRTGRGGGAVRAPSEPPPPKVLTPHSSHYNTLALLIHN